MNAWVGDLFGVLDNFKPWCGNRFIMEREAPLSMGAPQPRLASRRIPRSPGWLLDGFPAAQAGFSTDSPSHLLSPSLTFSHLLSPSLTLQVTHPMDGDLNE